MVSCLQLGAADYMLKPLRHNELRNLWARVYWWRRVCSYTGDPCTTVDREVTLQELTICAQSFVAGILSAAAACRLSATACPSLAGVCWQ